MEWNANKSYRSMHEVAESEEGKCEQKRQIEGESNRKKQQTHQISCTRCASHDKKVKFHCCVPEHKNINHETNIKKISFLLLYSFRNFYFVLYIFFGVWLFLMGKNRLMLFDSVQLVKQFLAFFSAFLFVWVWRCYAKYSDET